MLLSALIDHVSVPPVWAYIGPGLAGGALSAVLGVLAAIAMLVVGVVWYPLKRLSHFLRTGGRGA